MANYLSARNITANYDFCATTTRNLIREIKQQMAAGRYDELAVLDGCGTRVREDVLIDYLKHRRALKDEVARQYVEPFKEVSQ